MYPSGKPSYSHREEQMSLRAKVEKLWRIKRLSVSFEKSQWRLQGVQYWGDCSKLMKHHRKNYNRHVFQICTLKLSKWEHLGTYYQASGALYQQAISKARRVL